MFCKYCGAEISENSTFCKKCGKAISMCKKEEPKKTKEVQELKENKSVKVDKQEKDGTRSTSKSATNNISIEEVGVSQNLGSAMIGGLPLLFIVLLGFRIFGNLSKGGFWWWIIGWVVLIIILYAMPDKALEKRKDIFNNQIKVDMPYKEVCTLLGKEGLLEQGKKTKDIDFTGSSIVCPVCGGELQSTDDEKCLFCGALIPKNSIKFVRGVEEKYIWNYKQGNVYCSFIDGRLVSKTQTHFLDYKGETVEETINKMIKIFEK